MAALLSDELQQAVRQHAGNALPVVDPTTNRTYVLLPLETYERMRPLFEHETLTLEEQRRLLQDAGRRAHWDDPEMDAYDNYDEHRARLS